MTDKQKSKEIEKQLIEASEKLCKELFDKKELSDNLEDLEKISKILQQIQSLKDEVKKTKLIEQLNPNLKQFIQLSKENLVALGKYFQKIISKKKLEIKDNKSSNIENSIKIEQFNNFNNSIFSDSENNLIYIYFFLLQNSNKFEISDFPDFILLILLHIPSTKEIYLFVKNEKTLNINFSSVNFILENYQIDNSFLNLDLVNSLVGTEIETNYSDDIEQALDMEKIINDIRTNEILKDSKDKIRKFSNEIELKNEFVKILHENKINTIKTNNVELFNFIYNSNQ